MSILTDLHNRLHRVNLCNADCNCLMPQTETDLSTLVCPHPQNTSAYYNTVGALNFYHSCGCMCTDEGHICAWLISFTFTVPVTVQHHHMQHYTVIKTKSCDKQIRTTQRINTVMVASYQPCPCHLIYPHLFPLYHLTILLTFSHLSTPFSFHHPHLHLWKFNTPYIYSTGHGMSTYHSFYTTSVL
jgi:hypothetical protein